MLISFLGTKSCLRISTAYQPNSARYAATLCPSLGELSVRADSAGNRVHEPLHY